MEYYSSEGLKRAAKGKLAYQGGVATGACLLMLAILLGFLLIVGIGIAGTIFQPVISLIANMDPTGDVMAVQQQMIDMMLAPKFLIAWQLISAVVGALVSTLTTGYAYICLKISRAEKAQVSDLFFVYRNNPDRVILLYLLSFGIQLLIGLPADVISFFSDKYPQNIALYLIGNALTIASIVITYMFGLLVSQIYFLYLDDTQKSVMEVFRESLSMMKGHKGRLFYLQVSFIGWLLLCFITWGVLLLYVQPYMVTTFAEFYRNLKGEPLWISTESYPQS